MFWFRRRGRRAGCCRFGGGAGVVGLLQRRLKFNSVVTAVVLFVFTCYVCLLRSVFVADVDGVGVLVDETNKELPVMLSAAPNQYENGGFYLNRDQWLLWQTAGAASAAESTGARTEVGGDMEARLRHLMANPPPSSLRRRRRRPNSRDWRPDNRVDDGGGVVAKNSHQRADDDNSISNNNNDVFLNDKNSTNSTTTATGGGGGLDINCNTMHEITHREYLASGWTKAVYSGKFRGLPVAVKTVNTNGHDIELCLAQPGATMKECYRKSSAKILKEIVLLRELMHDNMLKVLGYCIPNRDFSGDDGSIVAMVAELGEPMDIIRLLQMSWEDRLRISLGISRLLYHLAHSPLGSLAMNDFRRQQFVLTRGEVKLSDVDDIGLDEPMCNSSCLLPIPAGNTSISIDCVHGYCQGFNEKQNIIKAGRHFTTFLLPHGAPESLRPLVNDIVSAYNTASWDTQQLLDSTLKVVHLYTSGQYLVRNAKVKTKDYYKFLESDLPGAFDYRCQLSMSGNGCTLSVFDVKEAQDICSDDPDCQAFVMTQQTTWTGRHLVHFKNNVSRPSWNSETVLYMKIPVER